MISASSKPRKLVNSINSDFRHIYEWSLQNHMVFDSRKFKILNIGPKRLNRRNKGMILYGDRPVRWERTAKLLGATFDIHLNFLEQIHETIKKVSGNSWRIYCNSSFKTGANTFTLLRMLDSYVQPQLTYGSNLWIFQAFPDIRFDLQPRRPYGGAFKELSRVYSRLLGACATARKHTSFTAIHVRLGP